MWAQSAAIGATAIFGGLLPLLGRGSNRVLHLLVSFATGVFLGIVFMHLLPETAALAAGARGGPIWPALLAGVVGLYLLEKLVLDRRRADADPHVAVGWGSFFGLSIHALTTGLGLAAMAERPELELSVFLSLLAHKLAEGFSLGTVLLLGGLGRRRIVLSVGAFALVTPVGLLLGSVMLDATGPMPIVTALATGTFLFVAVCDLLPEAFHERRDTGAKLLLLGAGILVSQVLAMLGG